MDWILSRRRVVIEKLAMKGVEHGRHANRLIANFMHRKLLELVAVKALRREWILVRRPGGLLKPYSRSQIQTPLP